MMKNLITVICGFAFLISGIAYLQTDKANRQLAEQLLQVTEKAKITEAEVATLRAKLVILQSTMPQSSIQLPPRGSILENYLPDLAPAKPADSHPAVPERTGPKEGIDQQKLAEVLAKEVGEHAGLIKARVERAWRIPQGVPANLWCRITIALMPNGELQNVSVIESSRNSTFDGAAVAAVKKASPFPMPANPEVAARFRSFNFRFKPGS